MFAKIIILMCTVLIEVLSDECITPNGEKAECISIRSCSILLNSLLDLKPENIEFVKKSQCGYADQPLVCCGSSATYTTSATPVSVLEDKQKLIPSRRFCGYQRYDDYIHTKNSSSNSSIDEFPWMASLKSANIEDNDGIYCAGSLINNRYVLTTAHCLHTHLDKVGTVRLGEYNKVEEKDCIKNEQFDECADPIQDYGVEEIIPHENYNRKARQNDIGLIRLNKTVIYTDYIRPICLPFPGTKFAKFEDILVQSGWGRRFFVEDHSITKKKILLRLLSNENCTKVFEEVNVTDTFTCTIEKDNFNAVSCSGDGGGPIMFSHRNQWHQEGIVAYGKACGILPSLNIRVSSYLDWILKNIKP